MGLFGYSSKKEENVIPDFKKEEKVVVDKREVKQEAKEVDHKDDFHESSLSNKQEPSRSISHKEFEIINSKLDLINARLEHLNARLEALERVAYDERRKW